MRCATVVSSTPLPAHHKSIERLRTRVVSGHAICSLAGTCDKSERMKPRHAAVLALVGWYLMMPPLTPDSASDCNSLRDKMQKAAHDPAALAQVNKETARRGEPPLDLKFALESTHEAFCIASDDPRLKQK